jgi:hypothetical protein
MPFKRVKLWERAYKRINTLEAVRNCSDKLRTLQILSTHNVPCLTAITANREMRVDGQESTLGKTIVFKNEGQIEQCSNPIGLAYYLQKCGYGTIKEEKLAEYRVILYRGNLIEMFRKIPKPNHESDFALKSYNSNFVIVRDENWRNRHNKILEICKKAMEVLKIDLCGFDVLINKQKEIKIIEANSGMGMCDNSIQKFYKLLEVEYGNEVPVLWRGNTY